MVKQTCFWVPTSHRHGERIFDQSSITRRTNSPSDDETGVHIENGGKIETAFGGLYSCDADDPFGIGCLDPEISF